MIKLNNAEIHHSICYDFLASIYRLHNNNWILKESEELLEDRVKTDDDIINWITEARENIPDNIRNLMEKFFNRETYFGLCMIIYIARNKIKDIASFIEFIDAISYKQLLELFIDTGYGPREGEVGEELIERLLSDEKEAVTFINKNLSFPPQQKWEFLQFFLEPQVMKKELIELLQWYYENLYINIMDKAESVILKHEKELGSKLDRYGEDYLKLLTNVDFNKSKSHSKFVIGLSYFYEFQTLSSGPIDSDKDLYLIGYRYPEVYVEGRHSILSNLQLYKSLADETRLNIISLLSKRPWYGKEIAQKLNLSNSTVSYHLSMLLVNGIVRIEKEDNRVYFILDETNMRKIINNSIDKLLK